MAKRPAKAAKTDATTGGRRPAPQQSRGIQNGPASPPTGRRGGKPDTGSTLIDPAAAQDTTRLPNDATQDVGIRGYANWSGNILPEPNKKLQLQLAYGIPGNQQWGAWEKTARTNPAASTALEMVCSHIRDARVEVEENEDNPDEALAGVQADFVRDNVQKWLEPKWPQLSHGIAWGFLTYGFKLSEVIYGVRDDKRVPGGKAYFVKKLADRLPSTILPNGWIEKDDELAVVKQYGQKTGRWQAEVDLPANKTLLFTWMRQANNYLGFSALRPVWYLCAIYEELLKILAIGHQRETLGVPVAESDKDSRLTKDQLDRLQNFLQNLTYHENAAIALPPGVKMNWVRAQGSGEKSHLLASLQEIKLTVFEVFMAQQAALGTGNTGSRAVGNVHQQQKTAFVQGVISLIEAVLNGSGSRPYEGLVSKILVPNWGAVEYPPTIRLTLQQAELSPVDFTQALGQAVLAGAVTITVDDENTVREKLGLAPIDDAQRDAEKQKQAALALPKPSPQSGSGQPGVPVKPVQTEGASSSPTDGGTPASPVIPRKATFDADGNFQTWRSLRPAERVCDFAAMEAFLDAAPQGFENGARPLVVAMVVNALPQVRGKNPKDLVGSIRLDGSKLSGYIGDWLSRVAAEGYREVGEEMRKSVAQVREQHQNGKPTASVKFAMGEGDEKKPGEPDDEPTPAEETEDFVDAQTVALTKKISARVEAALEREALDVDRTGGETDEIVSEVIGDLIQAKTLQSDARSVLTKAWNMGRQQFAEERGDQVESATLSAVLDGNTCDYCRELDGEELDFGSDEEEELTPPLRDCDGGDACRCIKVFTFKDSTEREEPDDEGEDDEAA